MARSGDVDKIVGDDAPCHMTMEAVIALVYRTFHSKAMLERGDARLDASAKQIQQVLSSLIANAWESMESKAGWVRVTLSTVAPQKISSEHRYPLDYQIQDSAYACLEIQDSGMGIAAVDLDSLFDPFFTSKFPGRGMGLSVVLGILRAHKGAITVESHPGRGSIFRVYLPCLPEP